MDSEYCTKEVIDDGRKRISERLMKLTKDEMMEATIRLGLEPLPRSAKKADWAAYIEEKLPEYMQNIVLQLRQEEYLALNDWIDEPDRRIPCSEAHLGSVLFAGLRVLESYGLAWRERQAWYLHENAVVLLTPDSELLKDLEYHDLLYDEMQGWLLHLGMMPLKLLLERVTRSPGLTQEQLELMRGICFALLIARDGPGCLFPDDEVEMGWAVHDDVEDPMRLLMRLKSPMIASLDYPEYTVDELVRSQRSLAVPGDPGLYRPLMEWMFDREEMDDDRYVDALEMAVYLIQNGENGDALEALYDSVTPRSEKDARRGMEALMTVMNRIPLWDNKGRSANELLKLLAAPGLPKMPGRNDPCTCGSGKKYKNCCGRRLN